MSRAPTDVAITLVTPGMSVQWGAGQGGTSDVDEGGQYALKRPQSPLVTIKFQALTQQYPLLHIGTTELNIFKMSIIKEDILYFMKLDEEKWPRSGLRGLSS